MPMGRLPIKRADFSKPFLLVTSSDQLKKLPRRK